MPSKSENKVLKILVIKFRHIGDVLLSAVLAKNLKEAYPDAKVDYLGFGDDTALDFLFGICICRQKPNKAITLLKLSKLNSETI